MWETIAAVSAFISVCVSIIALLLAKSGAKQSTTIATEALKTARQANDIALGRLRKSPAIEIFSKHDEELVFTDEKQIGEESKIRVSINNTGEIDIDGLAMELIGIQPFTYPVDNINKEIRPLPSTKIDVNLDTIMQPSALAHIDMRFPILVYLRELNKQLPDNSKIYKTTINVVLKPKAIGDPLPSGVLSKDTKKDRTFIKILFNPSITDTKIANTLFKKDNVAHRVYSP